ncbi:hypothetical protein [Nocardioides piscis]|uniref:Camelysin metallo-endopeptidase n=1 Tax=Nocardioides piscis TaxID=2714938 RepID=A0A6G7YJX9_9ACTN|nr:hypothetical protein [Nocardioides piscis]QIK77038.1 hypothetical protein G7071_17950 [Nocardioides piscis]
MKKPSPRTSMILAASVTPVALLATGALIFSSSYAAFTGQTRNSGNQWSTGSVNLTDDDGGSARFQVANMLPGSTDTKCIKVTANASVPSLVKGYAVNPVTSPQGLENRVKVTIEDGAGGTFADCTGFVASGAALVSEAPLSAIAQANSFESGFGGWAVNAGVQVKTYRITWKFDTAGMTQAQIDQLQGASTGIDMQWEMRTNG